VKRTIGLLTVALFALGLLAGPASAARVAEVGVINGQAQVGKTGSCDDQGGGSVSGAGLGLPVVTGKKNAVYKFEGATVLSAPNLQGLATVCGYLQDVASKVVPGVGAACGASKSWGGRGWIRYDNGEDAYINKLGWKVSAGTAFPITANVYDSKGSKLGGTLVGVARASASPLGAPGNNVLDCVTKTSSKTSTSGLRFFDFAAAFAVIPVQEAKFDQQDYIIICKDTDDDLCLYHTKKTP